MKLLATLFPASLIATSNLFKTEDLLFRSTRQVDGSGLETFVQNIRVTIPDYQCISGVPPFDPEEAKEKITNWWPFGNDEIVSVTVDEVQCGSIIVDFNVEQTGEQNEFVDVTEALSTDFEQFTSFIVDGLNITDVSLEDVIIGDHVTNVTAAIWTQTESDNPTTSWDPTQDDSPGIGTSPSLPMPYKVATCERHDVRNSSSMSLTMKTIKDLANMLYDDLNSKGHCYTLIIKRIYGSLQFSRDLILNGQRFLDNFDFIAGNAAQRDSWAREVKMFFKESFDECETASCVVELFCESMMLKTQRFKPADGSSENFKKELVNICLNDGWRFQEMMSEKTTDVCKFSMVPMHYAPMTCDDAENYMSGSGSGDMSGFSSGQMQGSGQSP